MFTGLIEATGRLVERHTTSGGVRVRIESPLAAELSAGDSVAVNGVCLTAIVADRDRDSRRPRSRDDSRDDARDAGARRGGESRAAAAGRQPRSADISCKDTWTGSAASKAVGPRRRSSGSPSAFHCRLRPYLVPKGSIAVDGISLTVAGLGTRSVRRADRALIRSSTRIWPACRSGICVNLECDMVGKYVVRAAQLAGLASPRRRTCRMASSDL